jgi:tetratricopeptide (TPR) repeat protein
LLKGTITRLPNYQISDSGVQVVMRFALAGAISGSLLLAGCARPTVLVPPPAPEVSVRLAQAAALLRLGCFDCLEEALAEYEAIRTMPNLRSGDVDAATDGAIRAALVLEMRQRELGMPDDGYLQRARDLIGAREDRAAAFASHMYTVQSIPRRDSRFAGVPDAEGLRRSQELRANFPALIEERRAAAGADPLAAYAWLSFYCTHRGREDASVETLLNPLLLMRGTPIVEYRAATCTGPEPEPLTTLLERQPRYVEITYWLAHVAQGRLQIEEAERLFGIAFKWRPRWPAVTAALGNVYAAFEENEQALAFFDRTLTVAPDHPEALIGRIKALSLLNRPKEAFAAIDAVLAAETRVFPGEAYYWRAWNFTQIQDLDMAWTAIEQADRLWVNSEVSKLGGIIAYRRWQRPAAIQRFQAAQKLAPEDCENAYYLGIVHAEQREWPATRTVFEGAARCIDGARDGLKKEIATIEASNWAPERKQRLIARREGQIGAAARMLATSWFNIAVASFNLGSKEEARQYAERVVEDEQFAERARDILKRLQ